MTTIEQQQRNAYSRRDFIKTSASGISIALLFGPQGVVARGLIDAPAHAETAIGAWVRIDTDGSILILNPAAEMGQGSMTALPLMLAEEMDADWSMVRIEDSPIEPNIYGRSWSPGGPGTMMTVGSMAVRGYYMNLRRAGAQIRQVLLDNAARKWGVPITELTTEPSTVIHAASGRRLSYGEIAAFAEVPAELPAVTDAQLKNPQDFRLIGRSVPRHDIPAKTDGSARYAMDVQAPNMVYAMVSRSPVHNGRPVSYNESVVRAMPGVLTTVVLDHGVGVIGDSVETVMKARERLEIEWAKGAPAEGLDSEAKLASYAEIPGSGRVQPRSVSRQGDAQAALSQAAKRYTADYYSDHVYHAQMEPLCAVVSVSEAGDSAEVWVGTQATSGAREEAARALGVDFDRVTLHPCFLGGGFGRRSNSDYVVEAVQLSKAIKRPVKLIWTRQDDLQYGQFRPMNLQRLEAGVDEQGMLKAWTHCIVGDGGGLLTSGSENEFYDIPNQAIELCSVPTGVRLKHWRAVGHGFTKYAIEAFIDEIAADWSIDPYEYRRRLMHNQPRALAVLDAVAEMCDWGSAPPEGRARGMAFGERSGSLAAGVAEISVDRQTGKIRVHKFWCAVDGGIIIQPNNAEAQIEGGIVTGLSSVLYERVTLKDGKVQQSNYDDYPVFRMSDMPEVEMRFIKSYERPEGLGEPSVPVTGGAVANAFAALTGKRLYHLPFTPDRVKAVLG